MLISHNLKKSKGQYASFGIIICITASILNIALVLSNQMSGAYDRRFEELDTAEINVIIPKMMSSDELAEDIAALSGVEKTERHEGVFAAATVREFKGSDFDMSTVFYNLDEERSLNRPEFTKNGEDAVYVPAYLTRLGGFEVGGNITYTIDGEDHSWRIGGAVSEMQYGNYGTGFIGAYLPEELYRDFAANASGTTEIAEYSLKTSENADLAAIKREISTLLSDNGIPALAVLDRESGKQARTMVCDLLIAIFLALAAIILAVSIFLSNFKVRNTIDEEMTEMGVLKALGYTSAMIITGAAIPYTLIGGISSVLGAALSYLVLPLAADILGVQSGFSFAPAFDISALLLTIIITTAAIALFSYIAARKIRKLEPINAIRGITGTSSGKNRFPLETSKAPAKLTLILKQIASSAGQNILLFAVSFGIMVLMSFAGTLVYNVNIKPDNFMNTLQEETPSVIFAADNSEKLREALERDSRVSLVLEYGSSPVSYADGSLTAFACEDFSRVTNDISYRGKNPANADEIAVGSALADKYEIGDTIEIKSGDRSAEFTIVGYVQSVNNGGEVCELTAEGFARISETAPNSLNVYLDDKIAEEFINEYEREHGELISSSVNYEKLGESGRRMYAGIVSAVTVAMLIISILVVLLVMYVIINSLLTRRRQELGIYKAIGWSSAQLISQSAASFLPSIAAASVLSAALGLLYLPAMNRAIFGLLGAYKNHFEIPLWFLLFFAAIFIAVCFAISVLLARPIKKITAYSLLKE
ncbi:MAG: FtsX-like permease family protein [Oscillospiraceae bacterium]|nr:FtsX-like permease family protein [Oscillospiraceae bacterium]